MAIGGLALWLSLVSAAVPGTSVDQGGGDPTIPASPSISNPAGTPSSPGNNPYAFTPLFLQNYPEMLPCEATAESLASVVAGIDSAPVYEFDSPISLTLRPSSLYSRASVSFKIALAEAPYPFWIHPNPELQFEQSSPDIAENIFFSVMPETNCSNCIAFLTVDTRSYCFLFKRHFPDGTVIAQPKDPDGVLIAGGFAPNAGGPQTKVISIGGGNSAEVGGICSTLRVPQNSQIGLAIVMALNLLSLLVIRRRRRSTEKTAN